MLKKVLSLVVVFIMMSSIIVTAANDDGDPLGYDDYVKADHNLYMGVSGDSDKDVYEISDTTAVITVTATHQEGGGDPGDDENKDLLLVLYEGDTLLANTPVLSINAVNDTHVGPNGTLTLNYNYSLSGKQPGDTVVLSAIVYDYGMFGGDWKSKNIGSTSFQFTIKEQTYDVVVSSNASSVGLNGLVFSGENGSSLTNLANGSTRTVVVSEYDTDTYDLEWSNNPATINGANETVTATFSYKQYSATVEQSADVGATIPVTYEDNGKNGTDFTATLDVSTVPEGYVFTGWNGVETSSTTYTGTFDGSDVTVTANFAPVYSITALTNPASGTGALFSGTGNGFRNGTHTVTLDGYSTDNYVFTGWSNGDTDLSTTVEVEGADASVTANFVDRLYSVTASANISGTNAVFSGTGSEFLNGDKYSVDLVAFDDTTYNFDGWSASKDGTIDGESIQLVANFSLIPPIPDTYAVRVSSNLPGAGAVFSGYGTGFADGEAYNVELVTYDTANYTFIGFSPVASGNIAGSDVTIVANFEQIIPDEPTPEEPPVVEPPVDEPEVPFEDEPTPEEQPVEEETEDQTAPEEDEFLDEETPEEAPDALPETGGIPMDAYSVGGFLSILAGAVIKRRKK